MRSGIDTSAIDPAVRPQDDLFEHVNGAWLATATIPQDRSRYGAFDALADESERAMRELIEAAAERTTREEPSDTPGWRVGALYRSFMDVEAVNQRGLAPLLPGLRRIAQVRTGSDVAAASGTQQREGAGGLVGAYVTSDAGNPGVEIAYLSQAGIGLPDEEYYRAEAHAEIRVKYVAYLEHLLTLAAPVLAQADLDLGPDAAARVMALETAIAASHRDKISSRDAVKGYNKLTRAELDSSTTGFDWQAWSTAIAGGDAELGELVLREVVARQPEQLTAMGTLLSDTPIADWQAWLAVRLINGAAGYLTDEVVEANFDFYGRTLSGTPELKERWKRGVRLVEGMVGEDAGQMYVAAHFPQRARERMDELVANVVEAFRQRIATMEWMGESTRAEALAKLAAFRPKIGHPRTWRDYSAFVVDPHDLVGNIHRGIAVETDREMRKVGQPIDLDEWLMTPQTVNAYYHPLVNEIVFPAAILRPPFFDVDAEDAVNYGGIGAVIAHEIGHGFDDQGSRYDGEGRLRDWWSEQDRAAFEAQASKLIAHFDELSPRGLPDERVKGGLTVGENIGDLCGLEMALAAYLIANGEGPQLDGLSAEQRFFYGWAHVWRSATRPEEARRLLSIDPHSPPDLRANVARNVDAFHRAFETKPGDGMWLEQSERVRIF